jgi:energy-coupling factor transport system permease protein
LLDLRNPAGSLLGRLNPAAKLTSAAVVMAGLVATASLVSASFVLGCELLTLPLSGIGLRPLLARTWPLPVGAGGVAVANLVASDAHAMTIAAISLRLIAIALPGVLVFASTEAVDLADSLVQQLHLPARFAYGALAALRLLPLLSLEWGLIWRARRARGIDAGRSPVRAAALFVSAVFALLVAAVRRATRLAMAMDSRGFASGRPRTAARAQHVGAGDWALVAGTVAVVAGANVLAVATGTWHAFLA